MPGERRLNLLFPLKGLHTASPRGVQPFEFSAELQNVWPQDAGMRLRGGQRPGTSKLYAAQLAGSTKVTSLLQTTLIQSGGGIGSEIFHDYLSYTNGPVNSSSANAKWTCRSNSSATNFITGVSSTTDTGAAIRSGTRLEEESGSTGKAIATSYTNDFGTLPANYTWRTYAFLSYTNPMGGLSDVNGGTFRLCAGVDPASSYANRGQIISAVVCRQFAAIVEGEPAISGGTWANFIANAAVTITIFDAPLSKAKHQIELRVTGNASAELWVDGTKQVSRNLTTTRTSGQKYAALVMGSDWTNNTEWVDNLYLFTGSSVATTRTNQIVLTTNGKAYVGDTTSTTQCTGSVTIDDTNAIPQIAGSRGYAYIADGTQYCKRVDLSTKTVSNLSASAGTAPQYCQLACFWRDRLILAAPVDSPQNFFASAQGTHDDFDYSEEGEGAPFAGNAALGAFIGDPLTALMPMTDDYMLLGSDSSLWRVTGDPTSGGTINLVSNSIGVAGARAWCQDPNGAIYFVGNGGFYRVGGEGEAVPLSRGILDGVFANINRATTIVQCVWDRDNQGCMIFMTSKATGASTHYWWDSRTGGFFPMIYPDNHGPMSVLVYDGDAPNDRAILLGARNGYVQKIDDAALSDDGTAISSICSIGPISPDFDSPVGPDEGKAWMMTGAEGVLGDGIAGGSFNLNVAVRAGSTPYNALNASNAFSLAYTVGSRFTRLVRRVYGGVFYFRLTNSTLNKTWNFERLSPAFRQAGDRTL
jgi:hypothetical protein